MNGVLQLPRGLHPYDISFSPFDSSVLAVAVSENFGIAGKGSTLLYRVHDGRPAELLHQGRWSDGIFSVCFAEVDESLLFSCSGDGSIHMWNTARPQPSPICVWKEHTAEVHRIRWTYTRGVFRFASASWDGTVKIWQPDAAASLRTLAGQRGNIYDIAWSPHDRNVIAAAAADHTAAAWDTETGKLLSRHSVHSHEVLACDYSKYLPGTLLTASVDCSVKAYDMRAQEVSAVLMGHTMAVRSVRCSHHDAWTVISAGYDMTTCIWDLRMASNTVRTIPPQYQHRKHSEFVSATEVSALHHVAADCAWDSSIQFYSLAA